MVAVCGTSAGFSALKSPRAARRGLLLLGTSLLVYTALPSAALAQNECGAPPPGGGTVTCTPAGNPYPSGVDYDPLGGLVADLTVVLQPGVVVTNNGTALHPNGVEMGTSTAGVDLVLQAGTNTQITTTAANHDAVDVVATDGTVNVALDDVDTTQAGSRGIVASGRGTTIVTADTVSTLGDNADGISAEEGNFIIPGVPPTVTGTSVTVNSVSTAGANSTGIIAFSENGDAVVDVGTVATGGDYSTAVIAIAAIGNVRVTSDTITTAGENSVGIDAQIFPFPDEVPVGTVVVDSGTVTTSGNGAIGIVALSPTTDVTVNSETVSTSGDYADGIAAFVTGQFTGPGTYTFGDGDVLVDSHSVSTAGVDSEGIFAIGADRVTVISDIVSTEGTGAAGIYAETYFDGAITITSGSVTTTGDTDYDALGRYGAAHGIEARANEGSVTITSGTVNTEGSEAFGIHATSNAGAINITSVTVTTMGARAVGISAQTGPGSTPPPPDPELPPADFTLALAPLALPPDISITSTSVSTEGDGAGGILAETTTGNIFIESGSVTTAGDTILGQPGVIASGAHGIEAQSGSGSITIDSTSITTGGSNANGIVAETDSGAIDIDSGTITAADGRGIEATSATGDINIESGSVTTVGGLFSDGIFAETDSGNIVIDSGTVSVGNGVGVFVINQSGDTTITSDQVIVTGDLSPGIAAYGDYYVGGDISVVSGSVVTTGRFANGIDVESRGLVSVDSTTIVTSGDGSRGIEAGSDAGGVIIESGSIATSGANARGIQVNVYNEADVVIDSGTIATLGDNGDGIVVATFGDTSTGDFTIDSTSVSTRGHRSLGIYAYHAGSGDIVVTSGTVMTAGDTQDVPYGGSHAIELHANSGSIAVASTTIGTQGTGSRGIFATTNAGSINITSGTITTQGSGAIGIFAATGPGSTSPELPPTDQSAGEEFVAIAPVALPPDISITSGSVTTAGAGAHGIHAISQDGNIFIESGTVTTSGADSDGIVIDSRAGAAVLDANAVNVTGAGSDAIVVTSATTSGVIVRGLVRSTNGFAIQATGGAATISTTASGTIRGRIDLTDNADRVNNAGTFDAIGTSQFGGGADVFNNTGTTRSTNGAAVFAGLETFDNSGLIDFGDGAASDRLTVGNFNGLANSRLTVDVDFTAGVADVLVTGVATGSTTVTVNAIGSQFGFTSTGILVVDAAAGTGSTAFTLAGGNTSNGYITTGLIFEPSTFNFLLVNAPGQPIFETALVGGMTLDIWHQSADAVEYQLEAARAPSEPGSNAGNLTSGGRFGGWIQVYAGETEREATQSFTAGATTTTFDVSYEQQYEGLQAGFDHQSGPVILGLTFGAAKSDSQFETSPSVVDMDSMNLGAYFALSSGSFYANVLAKVEWIDLETNPGAGLVAEFDAMAYGVRGVAGFRFDLGHFFVEPSVSLSWVTSDVDDYQSGGATISFDNATSLRGTAGLRVGGAFATGGGGMLSPFAGLRVVEEFSDDNQNDFFLGTTLNLMEDGPGTHGEASAGLTFTSGSVEAFLRGELDFGSDVEGRTVRGGVRLRF